MFLQTLPNLMVFGFVMDTEVSNYILREEASKNSRICGFEIWED